MNGLRRLKRWWLIRRGRWLVPSSSGTSITPALPAGTKPGDLLVLVVNGEKPIAWIVGDGDKKVNIDLDEDGQMTGVQVESGPDGRTWLSPPS